MAVSLIHNALQVNFDSVLSFPDEGMVQIFKALESTGLHGFLGCPFVLYGQDLESFFRNVLCRGFSDKLHSKVDILDEVPKDLSTMHGMYFLRKESRLKLPPVVLYISSSSSSESLVSIRPRSPDAIPSSSSSSSSRMHFTEDIPQTYLPTAVVPSADYTESFAQLQASVDQIQIDQVQTRDDVAELKATLSSKITDLEAAFAHAST
ncbi:hypothetical protein F511_34833 [Dorcoceras hygrometricum]|uniref:Uncharacterized protein n=1 Tax=Dorcoceras hygrometricum TaxID=472368 RepID=A0A2Z7CII1_9LAMI|nr:hypothetical protein F511_34833 [Dorcoceras hygrometricum]